jgi:hypothetical protein
MLSENNMDEKTRKKILDWILGSHEHHVSADSVEFDLNLDTNKMTRVRKKRKRTDEVCVDNDYPYVNSIELEKFIKKLK